jgi:hypothetical protein
MTRENKKEIYRSMQIDPRVEVARLIDIISMLPWDESLLLESW